MISSNKIDIKREEYSYTTLTATLPNSYDGGCARNTTMHYVSMDHWVMIRGYRAGFHVRDIDEMISFLQQVKELSNDRIKND